MTTNIQSKSREQPNLPRTFGQLIGRIFKGFFSNFFRNIFKALLGTAMALYLPKLVNYLADESIIGGKFLDMVKQFVISPGNLLKGCLLSSALVLTIFSFLGKVWFVGVFKSIVRFTKGGFSYLNVFRNSATTSFSWGIIFALIAGQSIKNPLVTITLIASSFLAGAVPQSSGLVYFARFFWNRFYASTVTAAGLKPADEFIRGSTLGFTLALLFKGFEADTKIWFITAGAMTILLITANFRQKKEQANAEK